MDDAVFVLWSWFKTMEKDFAVHLNQWSSNLKEALLARWGGVVYNHVTAIGVIAWVCVFTGFS